MSTESIAFPYSRNIAAPTGKPVQQKAQPQAKKPAPKAATPQTTLQSSLLSTMLEITFPILPQAPTSSNLTIVTHPLF